jgi:hypothetical protein
MSEARPHPLLATQVSKYPNYPQAKAYLIDFLAHGRRAFFRTHRYAYYKHSLSIQIIVIHLKSGIYEVRAYPVDAFSVATLEKALKVHDFRAWLFTLDYRTRKIYYIAGSQKAGIERYKQVKQVIKTKPTLALASQAR